MATAIYGGSFDPPHVGHVLAAQYVLSVGVVQRVVVVPVYRHALAKNLSSFDERVKMCQLAFGADERISVSEIERTLPEPSYTLRTILALQELEPQEDFRLLIGADVLAETQHWHRFEEVAELAPPVVLGRVGAPHEEAAPAVLPEISSTEARGWWSSTARPADMVRREQLIPKSVRELIERTGLYQREP